MWNFVMPALTAIGINSGLNVLRRRPILENAGTAGVTGGILGGFNGGGLFGGTKAATAGAIPKTAAEFEAAMGLPSSEFIGGGGSLASAATGTNSMGLVFNPATGTYLNPEYFAGATTPLATYTGGEGLLSNAMGNLGSSLGEIKDYITPQNLVGVSSILSNMNAVPRPVASGANTITGTPPKFVPFTTGQVFERKRRG